MALITCPECGMKVSDRAVACPNCGFPIAEAVAPAQPGTPLEPQAKGLAASEAVKPSVQTATKENGSHTMIAVIAVACVLVAFIGIFYFVSTRPSVNGNNVVVGKRVINAVDEYLDGNCTASAALLVVSAAYDDIDTEDDTASSVDLLGYKLSIMSIESELDFMVLDNSGSVSKIKEHRNKLASYIGEPQI